MASKIVTDAVTESEDGTFAFNCPVTDGSCGDRDKKVPFNTSGWPTAEIALARAEEHVQDHLGVAPMSTLEDFRAKHGLTVTPDGKAVVTVKDLL